MHISMFISLRCTLSVSHVWGSSNIMVNSMLSMKSEGKIRLHFGKSWEWNEGWISWCCGSIFLVSTLFYSGISYLLQRTSILWYLFISVLQARSKYHVPMTKSSLVKPQNFENFEKNQKFFFKIFFLKNIF